MDRLIRLACLLGMVMVILSPPVRAEAVASIQGIQGQPHLVRNHVRISVDKATLIQTGDRLVTPKGCRLALHLRDNTRITLSETTQFEIKRYRFNQEKGTSDARFTLIEGAFRAVTGAIGLQKNPRFEIETPVATMGIRGTDFWAGFVLTGDLDVAMVSGKGVYIRNDQGQVEITQAGEGTTIKAGQAPAAVKIWPKEKLQKALATTGFEPE